MVLNRDPSLAPDLPPTFPAPGRAARPWRRSSAASSPPARIRAQLLPPRRRSPVLRWLAGLALLALGCAASVAAQRCEERAVRDLPPAERRVLFERSLQLLRTSCRDAAAVPAYAIDERCHEQAAFLQRFPECGDECRALTDPLTPSAIH